MLFKNNQESIKIRLGDLNNFSWITFKKGETMDLPNKIGEGNNLEKVSEKLPKVTEGQIGNLKVQTKQLESFLKELESIKGIGNKTAEDLFLIFPTKECLIDALKKGRIPIRDDIETKLRKKYG